MSGDTSKALLGSLLAADLGKRHFSQWTAKEQEEAIRRCGLSSSQHNNKRERIAILQHLHATPLPIVHIQVLRLIDDFGLPPSGARSKQQFSYYLLCYMCENLKFPPWDPQPIIKIIAPEVEELMVQSRSLLKTRLQPATTKPHFYRQSEDVGLLWSARRKLWDHFMESGVQKFLTELATEYVKVTNLVLAHSPKSKPCDLRCDIDDAQFKVDRSKAPTMFLLAWNAAMGTGDGVIDHFDRKEWRWALPHLLTATKRSVAKAVRIQYSEEDVVEETVYVGDTNDSRHSYYCVGAVWRSVKRHFSSSKRISDVISQLFVTKNVAEKLGLPTEEVNSR